MKREEATYIRGPFWNSFCRSHNIALHDGVTFTLIRQARAGVEEDEDEEGLEEGADQEDVLQDEILNRAEHVFKMTARAPNGDIKEFTYIPGGMCFPIKMYMYMYCLPI